MHYFMELKYYASWGAYEKFIVQKDVFEFYFFPEIDHKTYAF